MPLTIVSGAPCAIVDVPADEGGDGRRPAANKDGFDFQALGREEAEIDADDQRQRAV